MLEESVVIDLPCPRCGYLEPVTLNGVQRDITYTCQSCGQIITINSDDVLKNIDEIITDNFEEMLAKAQKDLDKRFKF